MKTVGKLIKCFLWVRKMVIIGLCKLINASVPTKICSVGTSVQMSFSLSLYNCSRQVKDRLYTYSKSLS